MPYIKVPSEIRKYTALHKADTKLDSRCWWLDIKAEITGSVLQCLVGDTISTFVSNLYTLGSLMVHTILVWRKNDESEVALAPSLGWNVNFIAAIRRLVPHKCYNSEMFAQTSVNEHWSINGDLVSSRFSNCFFFPPSVAVVEACKRKLPWIETPSSSSMKHSSWSVLL